MYRLISVSILVLIISAGFRTGLPNESNRSTIIKDEYEKLISSFSTVSGFFDHQADLTDFRTKTNAVREAMNPGSSLPDITMEKATSFSELPGKALENYLRVVYDENLSSNRESRIENILSELSNGRKFLCLMRWKYLVDNVPVEFRSVSVFDKDWNLIYDTELANAVISSEVIEDHESDNSGGNGVTAIVNENNQTRTRTLELSGAFGAVRLSYSTTIKAIVSPYITSSTNDAEYNFFTQSISCTKTTISGIPPAAEPFVYFGTGGSYAILYSNSTPATSPITINGGTDRFNTGLYNISGANGQNWSFSYDFSVDFPGGGIGITPVSNISALSLGAVSNSAINFRNYLYNNNVATGDVRAIFFNGGSFNADNFKILTGTGAGETGSINLISRFRAGYMAPSISGPVAPNFWPETTSQFNLTVTYLRGDHVLQPAFQLTSTRYNIPIGQIDTLKAKMINNSHAVKLKGGSISLDISSLNNKLTLLSSGTIAIDSVDTSASKVLKFVVRGNENGIVTPQVNISSLGWSVPVPPDVLINSIASIDSIIDVSPLIKTLTLRVPLQGFYNSSANLMIRDTMRVYLRSANSPYAVIDSSKAFLNTNGEATFSFSKAVNFVPYYIQLKHRNSIETWSMSTVFFVNSDLNYDFSASSSQAYGNNLIQVDDSPVTFAVYGGDVNQDGVIDGSDGAIIDNDALIFATGYVPSDIDGNYIVDGADAVIWDNNALYSIAIAMP